MRIRTRARPVAPLGHELVELGLVLGHAQSVEELVELALLLLEPPQRFGAVLVEGSVAARPLRRLPPRPGAPHAGILVPAAHRMTSPATHASPPYQEGED